MAETKNTAGFVAGTTWAEQGGKWWVAEVQITGGDEAAAHVFGGTQEEANARRDVVLAALLAHDRGASASGLQLALATIGISAACPAAEYVPALRVIMGVVEAALTGKPLPVSANPPNRRNAIEAYALDVVGPGEVRDALLNIAAAEADHG